MSGAEGDLGIIGIIVSRHRKQTRFKGPYGEGAFLNFLKGPTILEVQQAVFWHSGGSNRTMRDACCLHRLTSPTPTLRALPENVSRWDHRTVDDTNHKLQVGADLDYVLRLGGPVVLLY